MFRFTHALFRHVSVDAVIAGGGPSGIAVVGSLLQHMPGPYRQLWADPDFRAGRVNALYREVPSNTKVELFSRFATTIDPFRCIVDEAEPPNAMTALARLPQDQGCTLSYAADMCLMLSDGLPRHNRSLLQHQGRVTAAALDRSTNLWTVALDNEDTATTPRLVLCTGSSPIADPPPVLRDAISQGVQTLHLDTALAPSILGRAIDPAQHSTVAVVGASHSAVLVLMNLVALARTTHPHLRIKWFTRHKTLRYAQYMDGWILYDNTGLKGQAAQWARDNLEEGVFAASPVSGIITKLWTPVDAEGGVYAEHMPGCTHLVQAIGYRRDPLPELSATDAGGVPQPLTVDHDGLSGRFFAGGDGEHVPGLFGAGIAFPERVTDRAGNVEHAVGFWKFMNFCKRVVPEWVESPVRPALKA